MKAIRQESRAETVKADGAAALAEELEARGYNPDSPTDRHIIDALPDLFDAAVAAGLIPEGYRGTLTEAAYETRKSFDLNGSDRMSLRRNTICVVRNGERY